MRNNLSITSNRCHADSPCTRAASSLQCPTVPDPVPDYLAGTKLLFVTQDENIATFSDINISQYQCKSRVVPTMQKAMAVLQYAAKNQASLDAIVIGPDQFHFFHQFRGSKYPSPLLENKSLFT